MQHMCVYSVVGSRYIGLVGESWRRVAGTNFMIVDTTEKSSISLGEIQNDPNQDCNFHQPDSLSDVGIEGTTLLLIILHGSYYKYLVLAQLRDHSNAFPELIRTISWKTTTADWRFIWTANNKQTAMLLFQYWRMESGGSCAIGV